MSRQTGAEPTFTLIIAMRNEEGAIAGCIRSILDQDYPADRLEILVADGGSTDSSRAIAEGLLAGRSMARIFHNHGRIQATGWNEGIKQATGEIVGIVSGHAELAPDYVRSAVEALQRTGAWMVGGPVHAIADTPVGRAIACAMSTPFGVGGASFRYANAEIDVDTVFMGVCRAETYRRFKFDEEFVRNQDDELSYRLLDAGGRIVCSPRIRSVYRSRATFRSLWRQYYEYGFWKVRVLRKHPNQVRARQLVPPIFVAATAAAAALSPFSDGARGVLLAAVGSYGVALAGASLWVARLEPELVPLLPAAFATLHLAYGSGFLGGLAKAGRNAFPSRDARRGGAD